MLLPYLRIKLLNGTDMKMMKIVCLVVALMAGAACVSAQNQKGGQQPGDMAKQRAEEMKKELNLTDKQYTELYTLFQTEEKERSSKMKNMQPPTEDGQLGASQKAKDQQRQKSQNTKSKNSASTTEGRPEPPQMNAEMETQMKKEMEQRDAKVKKILTADQYAKWQKSEANRRPQGNGKKEASK